jgi:putative ABC transport system permease protein
MNTVVPKPDDALPFILVQAFDYQNGTFRYRFGWTTAVTRPVLTRLTFINGCSMFSNYFKTAIRSLWKNKTYSFLNILGLSIGIACAGLIFLWVEDEWSFDAVHLKKDRLYAVRENQHYDKGMFTHWSTPGLLGPAIRSEIPGIANTCRKSEGTTSLLFSFGERSFYAGGFYAEPSLFDMFTLPFVEGNSKTAFSQFYSLVITQKAAKKFFGEEKNVIGRTVRMDNKQDYQVTGVVKDVPANSSLQFEWIAPFQIYFQESSWLHKWENNSLTTYVELAPGASVTAINARLLDYIQKKVPNSISHLFLFSLNDWHLYDSFENGKQTGGGRIEYVHLFSVIGWIVLLIACINFMNLATARSEKRAREVGVRKVLGAYKSGLIVQFIGEALFMALLAAVAAVLIIALVLPAFNLLVQKELSLGLDNPHRIGVLLLITSTSGIVAGSYPSLYLSSFHPAMVLKGLKIKSGSAALIRKVLVVLQFTVSIVLIIGTVVIYQQIQHVKQRNLGFNKEYLLEMDIQGAMHRNFDVIKQDLLQTGEVENAALSDHQTIYGGNNTDGFTWEGKPPGSKILISDRCVTPEFFSTSGIRLLQGRNFVPADTTGINILITESLEKIMGGGNILGKKLHDEGDTTQATIVGVVNDYVYGNMYSKPDPVIFLSLGPKMTATVMYVRLKPQTDPERALAFIGGVMKKDNPGYPFDYRFVGDQFNDMFQNEMLVGRLSRVFATLAVLISCLGLFGLAAYTAERRTREIGIRKVLGASVSGISVLISKDFLKLVGLSCGVAFPIAWLAMHSWLQHYPYRIEISWWIFLLAGLTAMLIALFTVSFQAIRAAVANPVQSLRTE